MPKNYTVEHYTAFPTKGFELSEKIVEHIDLSSQIVYSSGCSSFNYYTQLLIWCISTRIAAVEVRVRSRGDKENTYAMALRVLSKLRSSLQYLSITVNIDACGEIDTQPSVELRNLMHCLDSARLRFSSSIREVQMLFRKEKIADINEPKFLLNVKSICSASQTQIPRSDMNAVLKTKLQNSCEVLQKRIAQYLEDVMKVTNYSINEYISETSSFQFPSSCYGDRTSS